MNRRRPQDTSSNNLTTAPVDNSLSNIDVVDDIEVMLAPNFDSDDPHEVLGCSSEADPEQLDRAYRDLSRKYHPANTHSSSSALQHHHTTHYNGHDGDDTSRSSDSPSRNAARNLLIFQKISQAYARATGKEEVPRTQEAAQQAYENMFGTYRELYYNEGGLIGIPYACDLQERLEAAEDVPNLSFSVRLCRVGKSKKMRLRFLRPWFIQRNMSVCLWMAETCLTYAVIGFCFLAFFMERDSDLWPVISDNGGQILDITGGIALMFAQFILCFWYGFCRYPAGGGDFWEWLHPRKGSAKVIDEDMEEIRTVCSLYLHGDDKDRFHPCVVWMCFPVVLVEQLIACFTRSVASVCCFLTEDEESRSYGQDLSKSIAALIVVMGYYLPWMYGNVYCKLAVTVAHVLTQKLYSAILFKKGPFEFLQSIVFGDFIILVFQDKPRRSKIHRQSNSETDAKDRTLSMDEDDAVSMSAVATSNHDNARSHETRLTLSLPTIESDAEAGALAAAKMAALSETAIYSKQLSIKSSSKTRSLSSFNPFTMLKSATYPKNKEAPAELCERDNDNVSLDLSYIDQGKIETFDIKISQEAKDDYFANVKDDVDEDDDHADDDDDDTSEGLNAEAILEDLADGESSNSGDLSEDNQILAAYKATKRRIEEAFYASTRIHVVGNSNSDDDYGTSVDRSADRVNSMPSRTRTIDSYDFTFENDDDSGTHKSPVLRVFDEDEASDTCDVEVGDNGQILGKNLPVDSRQIAKKETTHRTTKKQGTSKQNLTEWGDKTSTVLPSTVPPSTLPPMDQVFTNGIGDPSSFDEELTRSGTWDSSIANGKLHEREPSVDFDNDLCFNFLP